MWGKRMKLVVMVCVLICLLTEPDTVVAAKTQTAIETDTTAEVEKVREGLVEEDGHYRYYENGKQVKGRWVTIDGKKFYFKKTGNAPSGSHRIKGIYYVFNEKGQLLLPKEKKGVRVKTSKGKTKQYLVNKDGTAAKGWSEDKTYYADETGKVTTGIFVQKEKFYVFDAKGKYQEEKTKQLRKAAKYEKPFAPVKEIIGKPKKSEYDASCYGDGEDGILTYSGFTVFTYKPKQGKEIFMGVE